MARSRKIVANDGRRITADEDGTGVFDTVGYMIRFGHEYLNVFGRDMVHQVNCVFLAFDDERDSFIYDSYSRNRAAIEQFQLKLNFIENRRRNFPRPADQ